ncbi:non-ribosomal peptide synthetase [Paenibacillus macquariensis]|uniref:Fengycin family lipopeptide synthetase D n=1 Tax=Paenibacillus macquariensis TaxID=948756 RepID=A0ABY1K2P8_9BACL|nr:non-ribosomal peptide synthetase [Paenibacillus macquariensis]MEC0090206.1 non-ribosomal peptide synthetase [Paenibacillus macquariensis]OAB39578.1 hypothetical protein PMSM_00135 [Paenibacillus macquariensis subsp. macquariensis]SIR17363.1 fengycin family lipopeptide synthetase D [Paenibacillus macquariensis]
MDERHTYELSHGQTRFWIQSHMSPGSSVLNQAIAIRINQHVYDQYLNLALHKIIERHYILRTIFTIVNGEPRQIILHRLDVEIPVINLSVLDKEKRWTEAQKEQLALTEKPFDLERGPLLRACLIKLAEDDYIFYICMHHIIEDGWSMNLFFHELFTIYQALRDDVPVILPELPVQYVDYAHWQNQMVSKGKFRKHGDYWREKLAGELPILDLQLDFVRPTNRTTSSGVEKIVVEPEVCKRLKQLNTTYGTTMFMAIVACLNILLSKLTNQNEFVIGTPISGRSNKHDKNLIGLFVNTIVLRNHLEVGGKFSDFLQQVKINCVEAYAHQDYPIDKLLQELNISRQMNRAPLFDVLINFASSFSGESDFGGRMFEKIQVGDRAEINEFDLTVIVETVDDSMVITLNYATDLFMAATMRRIAENFYRIIVNVAKNPDQLLRDIDYLSTEEKVVISKINQTSKDRPQGSTIPSLITMQVDKTPHAVCIVEDNKRLTYKELHTQSNQIGNLLREYAIQPNQLVAVLVNRGTRLLAAILGIQKAGGAYVPIDPAYPQKRIEYMLIDSGCKVLIMEERYFESMINVLPNSIDTVICIDETEELTTAISIYKREIASDSYQLLKASSQSVSFDDLELIAVEDDLAYVMYTSGSSGSPKGVMITHKTALNSLLWLQEEYPLSEHDVLAQKTTMGFTDSVAEFFWPLIVGAQMTIIPSDTVKDPLKLYDCLKNNRVTVTQFVPSLLGVFLSVARRKGEDNPLPDLIWVFCGGEALPVNMVQEWYTIFNKAKLANIYGMTESVAYAINYIIAGKPDSRQLRIPLGRPISNTHVYILNREGQIAGFNTQGEICIGGAGITNGYWNRPDLTDYAFTVHPQSGEKLYRTGDLGYLRPDGMFEYMGRKDDQVKIRGFRVEMKEVEKAVVSCSLIEEAAVVHYTEETGLIGLICYYTAKQAGVNPEEVREHLRELIPDHMIPSHFVQLNELPLSSHGKVDRKNLPMIERQNYAETEYQTPDDIVERALAAIWEEVLEVSHIGATHNFFSLGGHSLKIAKIIFKIQEFMNINITYKEFLEHQTIRLLGNLIKDKISADMDISV